MKATGSTSRSRRRARLELIILTLFVCGFACRAAQFVDDEGVDWYGPSAAFQCYLYGIGLFLLLFWVVSSSSVRAWVYGSLLWVIAAIVSLILLLSSIPK
jgi:hypothetical protein